MSGFDFKQMETFMNSLQEMPEKVRRRGMVKALRDGGKIMARDMANRETHVDSGALKKSFDVVAKLTKDKKGAVARIGATGKNQKKEGSKTVFPTRYFHLVPGALLIPQQTLDATKSRVEEKIAQTLAQVIEKAFKESQK